MRPASPPLFSIRLIAGWLAAAALTTAVSFYLITRDSSGEQRPGDAAPTIYSRSALGYAAFYHTLQRVGIPVVEGTSPALAAADSVVVIAEPNRDERTLARVRATLRTAPAILLVLPKREGRVDPVRPDWLAKTRLLPADDVLRVLALVDEGATVERFDLTGTLRARNGLSDAAVVGIPQFVRSRMIEPVLDGAAGTLIGEVRTPGRRLVVVADPEILENHGLTRGDNALIAVALIRSLRAKGSERVVFDEVVHGYVAEPFGWLRLLFTFPFVLVTTQIAVAVALVLWSGSGRFGSPKPREPALALGKQSLIAAGARLFELAGDAHYLADRYVDAVLRETARRLQVPRGLSRPELIAWFARTGRAAPAAGAAGPTGLIAEAKAMHEWRREVLDES